MGARFNIEKITRGRKSSRPVAICTIVTLLTVPSLFYMPINDVLQTSSTVQKRNDYESPTSKGKDIKTSKSEAWHNMPAREGSASKFEAAVKDDNPTPKAKAKEGESKTNNLKKSESQAWRIMPASEHDVNAPIKPATICACAKCGTTSLWNELFAIVQGKSFESMNYTGPPGIHTLSNKKLWTNIEAKKVSDWSNFKNQDAYALIRDPKERIVSAWKSKVTCDKQREIRDHIRLIPELLDLAGPSNNITARIKRTIDTGREYPCLDLSDYLAVLSQIHSQGKEGSLDSHFIPQHLSCFRDAPPAMWKVVTTISDPNALCSLKSIVSRSANVSNVGEECQMVKVHNVTVSLNLTRADGVILDRITREEYEMLGPYLDLAA